ncbi:MAG TPA: thioesterase family protein [Acidobacteriaceae bacterium]
MSPAHTVSIRVRYAETDQMGVVYYANYFVWFEIGRVELMRSLGFDYREIEEQAQCFLPVVEANCRYRAPARYDDLLTLETRVLNQRTSMIRFGYRLLRATVDAEAGLLAEGETVHVVVDRNMQKTPLPERFAEALRSMGGVHATS